jgi:hypothetical protein
MVSKMEKSRSTVRYLKQSEAQRHAMRRLRASIDKAFDELYMTFGRVNATSFAEQIKRGLMETVGLTDLLLAEQRRVT